MCDFCGKVSQKSFILFCAQATRENRQSGQFEDDENLYDDELAAFEDNREDEKMFEEEVDTVHQIQQQCEVLNKFANKKKDAVDDVDTFNECIVDAGDDAEHDLKHERSLSFTRGSILILITVC